MGRTVVIEENLQDGVTVQRLQVGLVLGQLGENRDYVLHYARCPDPAEDEVEIEMSSSDDDVVITSNTQKKSKKEVKPPDEIDSKWVIEHARQVNRMLTGGISIVGIYLTCSNEVFAASLGKLRQCLAGVHRSAEKSKYIRAGMPHSDRYILHMCIITRKLTCRTMDVQDEHCSLKPAEAKFQSFLPNWVSLSCRMSVDITFQIPAAHETLTLEQRLTRGCQQDLENIWTSTAVSGCSVIDENLLLQEPVKGKGKVGRGNQVREITLFQNLSHNKNGVTVEQLSVLGEVKLVGSMNVRAFLNSKATYGDGVRALKVDAIRSILSRIELLTEEAEINNIYQVDEWSLVSPARVFAPFKGSIVYLGDYVFKDEVATDTVRRFSELLDVTLTEEDVVYAERSPDLTEVSMILKGDRSPDVHSEIGSELSSSCKEEPQRDKKVIGLAVAAVAALFAAALNFIWGD